MIWFFTLLAVLLAAAGGGYVYWRRKVGAEIAEGAAYEWAHFQAHEPDFVAGVSEEKFREVYARVNTPRFPGYALAILATFIAALPVIFAALTLVMLVAGKLGMAPAPVEIVRVVHLGETNTPAIGQCNAQCQLQVAAAFAGFYYFFGVLAAWLGIVAFYMRRFHKRRPGYLRDEIIRARGN